MTEHTPHQTGPPLPPTLGGDAPVVTVPRAPPPVGPAHGGHPEPDAPKTPIRERRWFWPVVACAAGLLGLFVGTGIGSASSTTQTVAGPERAIEVPGPTLTVDRAVTVTVTVPPKATIPPPKPKPTVAPEPAPYHRRRRHVPRRERRRSQPV